ncbi:MAG: protein-L-isoaspartate(D-aspartate) O-methyltransferase [Methanomassiliicoccus sp.]|nr:protein-L-isoaspartate(D-aspartate) O-methyltransferase [Methanomassiliicoccus sp.]
MRENERRELVWRLKGSGYVTSEAVLQAMERVPRHEFLPPGMAPHAYEDTPLPIGQGQTISAPHMVGMMLEALDLGPGMRVLEIGTGSGYHAALVAELVGPEGRVYTIERIEALGRKARETLERLGYGDRIEVIIADGTNGLEEHAPYDRIFVAAAGPKVPEPLKEQLADHGILMVPVGGRMVQDLVLVSRSGGRFYERSLGSVVFVPLIGEHGYEGN